MSFAFIPTIPPVCGIGTNVYFILTGTESCGLSPPFGKSPRVSSKQFCRDSAYWRALPFAAHFIWPLPDQKDKNSSSWVEDRKLRHEQPDFARGFLPGYLP